MTLTANATDTTSLSFKVDGGSALTATFNSGLNRWERAYTPTSGSHSVTATAVGAGGSKTSAARSFTAAASANAITRSALGRLAEFVAGSSNPFSTSDWTGFTGVNGTTVASATISSGNLRVDSGLPAGGTNHLALNSVASRSRAMVQAKMRAIGVPVAGNWWAGVAAHLVTTGSSRNNLRAHFSVRRTSTGDDYTAIAEDVGSTSNNLVVDFDAPVRSTDTFYRISCFADGLNVAAYDHDNDIADSATATTVSAGMVALSLAAAATGRVWDVAEFFAMSDRYVTVNGVPSGGSARIKNAGGTVLISAAANGSGVATLDVMPIVAGTMTKIEVLDSGGTILQTLSPSETIWGGDVFGYA